MDFKMIDYYFINNKDRFPAEKIPLIKQKIHEIDVRTGGTMTDADIITVMDAVQTKTPTNMLLISIFLGGWGVDRFMMDGGRYGCAQASDRRRVRRALARGRHSDFGEST